MAGVVDRPEDLAKVELLVCDVDGVVYRGSQGIPGAGEALASLERMGVELLFATNNATKTGLEAADRISTRTGYTAAQSQVITSGDATAALLGDNGVSNVLVLGEGALERTLEDHGLSVVTEPSVAEVVVVGLDRGITYRKLSDAMTAVLGGATLYATNTDASFPAADGLQPGAGSIVAALERATGVAAIVCGKPHEPVRKLIRERAEARVVAILGDRPETDLALGIAEGWFSILVLTGITRSIDEVAEEHTPTAVASSIVDVVGLLSGADQKRY